MSDNGAKWLRDWALIELLPSRHEAQLSSLKNKMVVGSLDSFLGISKKAKVWPSGLSMIINGTIKLQKVVAPMEELFTPPDYADDPDEKALLVGKYVAIEGLRFGLSNTLKSVVRHTGIGGKEVISEEWCITSATPADKRQIAFSGTCDCGSCIWDTTGRAAGILMAGCGMSSMNGVNDITYA